MDEITQTTQFTEGRGDTVHPDAAAAPRSRWGRSAKLGGGTGRLIGMSLAGGIVLAALIGAAAWWLGPLAGDPDPGRPWLVAALITASCLPVGFVLVWALLVDRDTLEGAVRHPEQSIESQWYDKAATGAFHDLLVVLGLGTFVVTMTRWEAELGLVGACLVAFMMLDVAARYLVQKRRG
ncbi:hypothetical protein NJC10_06915 [Micrococcus sp. M4NT]|uniref:hypothetical protein n=1 Tax=Micrococcus sp. M4NT TaxID=2957501 RepID=UPI0029A819B5|nr:hypothetical protein [Micrococcus sp. M4NT]MDX2341397.1 hypothetical protein [Micrococcus sp. M4NT]